MTRWPVVLLALLALAGCGGPRPLDTGDVIVGDGGPGPDALWERDLGRAIEFPPVWAADSWLVAATAGTLVRLDPETGRELWSRKLPGSPLAAPLVRGDLILQATDAPAGQVLALDLTEGREQWKWERGLALPTAGDSVLVLAIRNRGLVRLDLHTGRTLWTVVQAGAGWHPAVVAEADSLVLVPVRPDSVLALAISDGSRVWSRKTGAWPRLALAGGRLLVAADDSTLSVLEVATGDPGPTAHLGAMPAGVPEPVGDRVVQAVRDGTVHVYELGALAPVWTSRLESPLVSAPCVADSLVFQAAPRGRVEVLDLRAGTVVGSFRHPDRVTATPAVRGNRLAVGGDHGVLVVYRRQS